MKLKVGGFTKTVWVKSFTLLNMTGIHEMNHTRIRMKMVTHIHPMVAITQMTMTTGI